MLPVTASTGRAQKISVQYRAKGGTTYEFECRSKTISVHIAPGDRSTIEESWHVQAHVVQEPELKLDGWGTTPLEALRDAARAWLSSERPLTLFDWDVAEKQLRLVRAV